MNGLGRVRLFLCRIALVPVFASFVVTVAAQDSSSGAPAQQTKTRFSDPGSMKKNASSKKVPARIPAVPAACGPDNVYYKVRLNDAPPVDTRPLPGEALVYFIHDSGGSSRVGYPTTRMALDGKWVGANHGDSYFSISVTPGEHHVCAALQTSLFEEEVELAHFTAVSGTTYYFRTRLILSRAIEVLELERADSDQGDYLANLFPLSESKTKK